VLLAVLASGPARAGSVPFRPEDQVDVIQVDRHLIGIAGSGFPTIETDLELDEYVIALQAHGFVGVIATNHRLLALSSRSAQFAEIRYRLAEKPVDPDGIHVLDHMAVVELATRLLGFSPRSGIWVSIGLGPGEHPRRIDGEANIAAIVTPRRAIGFSSLSAGFVEEPLGPLERVESASFSDVTVTLVLEHKVLIFRAGDNRWSSLIR
jgi:hypothetical protein